MKTAVIYARYSSDSQTEQSIEGQLHVCQEYAQKNGILILDTYIDRAMTGTNDNRPDFQRMIKDSAKKEWNYVLVYKLDRFSRSKYETAIHKKTLKDNGVKVVSAMENIPDTPEGIILESLLEGMNQYYSVELAQKIKRGMKETRRKGLYQGGPVLFGYKIVDRKFVIDETIAEAVLYIFDQYSKGVYVTEIISALTAKGIRNRGKKLTTGFVCRILQNEKYTGTYKHGDEIIDNMYPQIIPIELFEKVRAILNKNKHGRRSIVSDYLLRFKLRCGYCGRPISSESGTGVDGTVKRYYKCLGRKKDRNGCQKTQVRKEVLEEFIVNAIVDEMSKPSRMDEVVSILTRLQNENTDSNSILSILKNKKIGVDKTIENIMAAIEKGVVTKTTSARLQELERQQEELECQILREQNKRATKVTEAEIREYYRKALLLKPKMLIECLVKEIVLYNDRIEIYYNTPIRTSPDDNRGSHFLTESKVMGLIKDKTSFLHKTKLQIEMYLA